MNFYGDLSGKAKQKQTKKLEKNFFIFRGIDSIKIDRLPDISHI